MTELEPQELVETQEIKEMPFVEHLAELRRAILISFVALFIGAGIGFYYHDWFLQALISQVIKQVPRVEFQILAPQEGFTAVLRLALLLGFFLALPVILREVFWFIGPAFSRRQRILILPTILVSYLLFVVGVLFAYFVLLPLGVAFLIGFTPTGIKPTLSIGRYIDFSALMIFSTGLIFQVPVLMLLLSLLGVIQRRILAQQRRYAYFASFIIAAVITPTVDIFTQSILGGVLIFLYEFGLFLMRLVEWGKGDTDHSEQ